MTDSLAAADITPHAQAMINFGFERSIESLSIRSFLSRLLFSDAAITNFEACGRDEGVELLAINDCNAVPQFVEDVMKTIWRHQLALPVDKRARTMAVFGFGGVNGQIVVESGDDTWDVCHSLIWHTVSMYQRRRT